ncbi:hypothetical protein DXG01_008860 [Tephrocybe rancida]|nr:hypothetical protein DXG01_008860 [Tephrocybe rancida]
MAYLGMGGPAWMCSWRCGLISWRGRGVFFGCGARDAAGTPWEDREGRGDCERVLDAIDLTTPTPESRAQAYIHAFLCSLCKSQAGAQHFWFGLRAATCIRSELMAGICDRALKRKYFSGILERGKKAGTEGEGEGEEGKSKSKKDEKKSDEAKVKADVGKIVNLMAGDANRVSMTVSASCFTHGVLSEILLASMFLYNLLGLVAFFGFLVLLLGWPLNPFIARWNIRIQKGLSGARDRRMGVLSKRIGAVKFIKFFAWEGKWSDKFMEMRAEEMRQMVKVEVPTQNKDKDGKTSLSATIIEDEGNMQALLGEDVSNVTAPEPRDINVRFPEGELSVITGPTTSGKTAFLVHGPPRRNGLPEHAPGQTQNVQIAFQTRFPFPWLLPLPLLRRTGPLAAAPGHPGQHPLRAPFDSARYNAVFDACAPRTDLHVLEDGDLTKFGPRGVSLIVGAEGMGGSGTGGILVTHHLDLALHTAHYLVRMLGGRIDTQGIIKDLRAQCMLDELTHDSVVTVAEAEVQQEALAPTPSDSENVDRDEEEVKKAKAGKKPRKLVKDEHREVWGVKWAIYKSYLKASSYWIWCFLAFLVLIAQVLGVSEKVWIMYLFEVMAAALGKWRLRIGRSYLESLNEGSKKDQVYIIRVART